MGKPRTICQALCGIVRQDGEEDGRDANYIGFDVDRSAVHEESRG